jgi:AraC family transcriptional regulator, arabinose operon regulatory protein
LLLAFRQKGDSRMDRGTILAGHFIESDTYYTHRPNGMGEWLIVYTIDGEGFFRTPAGEKACGAGDVGLLRCGVPHFYGTSPGRRWHFVWAHFPGLPETGYLPEEEVLIHHVVNGHIRKRIYRAFRKVLHDSWERSGLWQPLCENAIREILLLVAEGTRKKVDPRIEHTRHLMSQQMREPIRIDDLANSVGLSPSRLSHLYKEETGESIVESLNRMRIAQAVLLMGHTGRTASEAALDVGFQNYNHFAALFRKQTGLSPREYRKGQNRE